MKKYLFLFFPILIQAQEVPIGYWKDFLAYKSPIELLEVNEDIYCITESGLFSLNKAELIISRHSKITGLSDVGVNNIAYDSISETIIVSYNNCNIDLIKNGSITNISDIKRESITGRKEINDVFTKDGFAYISSSFGLIVLDIINQEIKDTYKLVKNGDLLEINACAIVDNTQILAATSKGLYLGESSSVLNDPNNWLLFGVEMNAVNVIRNKNIGCVLYKDNQTSYLDVFYPPTINIPLFQDAELKKITYTHGILHKIYENMVHLTTDGVNILDSLKDEKITSINYVITDSEESIWVADSISNLLLFKNFNYAATINPNGPNTNDVHSLEFIGNNLYVAHGGHSNFSSNDLNMHGVSVKNNYDDWINYDFYTLGNARDIVASAIHGEKEYFASWYDGVSLLENGNLIINYGYDNTGGILDTTYYSNNRIQVSDLKIDNNGNLWGLNSQVTNPLFVKTTNEEWQSFSMNQDIVGLYFDDLIIDDYDQKWGVIAKNGGLFVYDSKGTPLNKTDDEYKVLNTNIGNGNLPTMGVLSIAKDLDGEIWVGTTEGVCVFYSPELIFSNYNFDAQQILIQQGSYGQYLLNTESVKCIAIDGANRKWIGTTGSGVYLLSEDGTKEIHHFTSENSPLISNNITDIAINHDNGEIFLGTEKGVVSYRSDATKGKDTQGAVSVFPNPVKETYRGIISINGLVTNANIKIADVNGHLVYEDFAKGGQATWNGEDKEGKRVATGVYFVFSSDTNGKEKMVDKILFIH